MGGTVKSIDDGRRKIDRVDRKLVQLLNDRAAFAKQIGRLKKRLGLDVYSPEREEEILRNVMKWNKGSLPPDVLRRLYERVLDESRTLERTAMEESNSVPSRKKKRRRPR